MNLRIRKLRKSLDLTQKEFAERIGLKQNSVALIESGKRNISDQAILSICREFGVNEAWIKDGVGEMYKPAPSNVLDQLSEEYNLSTGDYILIEKFLHFSEKNRAILITFIQEVGSALSCFDDDEVSVSAVPNAVPHSHLEEVDEYEITTIAAHHDGNSWTDRELSEVEAIKRRAKEVNSTKK